MKTKKIEILWPDGSRYESNTWDGLLEQVRSHPWNAEMGSEEFRHSLAKRAWVWNFTEIDPAGTAAEIFRGLVDAGLVKLIRPTGGAGEAGPA